MNLGGGWGALFRRACVAIGYELPGTREEGFEWVWDHVRAMFLQQPCAAFPSFISLSLSVLIAAHQSSLRSQKVHHEVVASFVSPAEKERGKISQTHLCYPEGVQKCGGHRGAVLVTRAQSYGTRPQMLSLPILCRLLSFILLCPWNMTLSPRISLCFSYRTCWLSPIPLAYSANTLCHLLSALLIWAERNKQSTSFFLMLSFETPQRLQGRAFCIYLSFLNVVPRTSNSWHRAETRWVRTHLVVPSWQLAQSSTATSLRKRIRGLKVGSRQQPIP